MSLWAFRFLLWHICVYLVQPQQRLTFLIPFHLGDLTFFIAAGLHVIDCAQNSKPLLRFGPATKLMIVFLAWATLANYFGAFSSDVAWNGEYSGMVKNALVVIMLEAMVFSPQRALAVLMTIGACSLWWFKAGIRGIQVGGTYQGDRIMGPNVGLVQGPNEFGIFMVVIAVLFLGLYYIAEKRTWLLKWCFMALALTAMFIVIYTGSRAGLLGLMVLGVLYFPRLIRSRFTAIAIVPIAVFFAVKGIPEGNMERFKTIPTALMNAFRGVPDKPLSEMNMDETSAEERRQKNRDTWKLIKAYPLLGAGLNPQVGRYPAGFDAARGTVHNEWLMAGRQMGLPGMVLMLWMYMWVIITGQKTQWRTRTIWPELSSMAWLCKIMSVLLFFGGLFSTFAWNLLLFTLLAVTSQLQQLAKLFKG